MQYRLLKTLCTFLFALSIYNSSFTQVSISKNKSQPHPSAMLDIQSQSKGLLMPSMPLDSIKAIVNPKKGLLVFDTEFNCFRFYDGTGWKMMGVSEYNPSKPTGLFLGQSATYSNTRTQGIATCTDASGNVYLTGSYGDTLIIGNKTLKSQGDADIFIAKYNRLGVLLWLSTAGGSGFDAGEDITVDASGNLYLGGEFSASADFGSFNLSSNGGNDIFIAKYNASTGACTSAKRFGGIGDDGVNALKTDAAGNVYFTGSFTNTVSFGSSQLVSNGSLDAMLVKLNSTGAVAWAKQAGGTEGDFGSGIFISSTNQVFTIGAFSSTASFTDLGTLSSSGTLNSFITEYRVNGEAVDRISIPNYTYNIARCITGDNKGNFYIAGSFTGNLGTISSAGEQDMFMMKYDTSFNRLWARQGGGINHEDARKVVLDATGNIYVTGTISSPVFNSITLPNYGNNDIYLAKYNTSGTLKWVNSGGTSGNDQVYGMSAYKSRIWLSGNFSTPGPMIFYNSTVDADKVSGDQFFLLKYDE